MAPSNTSELRPVAGNGPQRNLVRGQIEIRGTSAPVGTLLVRVYDVVPDGSTGMTLRQPLGSTVTRDGTFEVCYYDDELALHRRERSRPDLLITVLGPETQQARSESNAPLLETELRRSAAHEEWSLLHLDLSELATRSLLQPGLMGAAVADPGAARIAAEVEPRSAREGSRSSHRSAAQSCGGGAAARNRDEKGTA